MSIGIMRRRLWTFHTLRLNRGTALLLNTKNMSWSVSFFGKPKKVVEALEAYSGQLSGVSKDEYDKAKPNLVGLVNQNFGNEAAIIKIMASGHGMVTNGVPTSGNCHVEITTIYGLLV